MQHRHIEEQELHNLLEEKEFTTEHFAGLSVHIIAGETPVIIVQEAATGGALMIA